MTYEDYNNRYKGAIKQKEINDKVSYTEDEFLLVLKKFYEACVLIPEDLDNSPLQKLKLSCPMVGGSRKTKRTKKKTRKSRKNGKSRKLRKSRK